MPKPTGRKRGRPKGSFTTNGSDMQLFSALHRGQARVYKTMQRSLELRIREARAEDPRWQMPDKMRVELAEIDSFLAKATAGMTKVHETAKKITEDLPTDRLEAQLRAEFIASIDTWGDGEWAVVEAARAKRLAVAA